MDVPRSTVLPAKAPDPPEGSHPGLKPKSCTVLVLDTGLPANPAIAKQAFWSEYPNSDVSDRIDMDGDNYVDPVAGHGIFIAGIIQRHAPGTEVIVTRLLNNAGEGADSEITHYLCKILKDADDKTEDPPDIINMSFSGYTAENEAPFGLRRVIDRLRLDHKVLFVAAAGNDATCRAPWPANFPGVISVGAVGPYGPAWFSNYGNWVDACAPGVDIVSNFFEPAGNINVPADSKLDDFGANWARWSGTSFAAPMVVAALARQLMYLGRTPEAAVKEVIDSPIALRLPGLGTLVDPS